MNEHEEKYILAVQMLRITEATVTRLRELLIEMESNRKTLRERCLICGLGHADDCKLAKELKEVTV